MSIATFETASEIKSLLAQRYELAELEYSLSLLLKQLHASLAVEKAEDPEFDRLSGAIFKYFESSQNSLMEFMQLWETALRINTDSSLALVLLRTFSVVLQVLSRKPAFVAYASKLAKDSYSEQSKFFNRCLSANSTALPACALDLLTAMIQVDASCADFLFENIEFSLKAFDGFALNRRQIKLDPITQVTTDQRGVFITFIMAFLRCGKYEVKLGCLKMSQFFNPIVDNFFTDSPRRLLAFLKDIEALILENSLQSKTLIAAFWTFHNTNAVMKLFEYDCAEVQRKLMSILTKLASPKLPGNVIFKVEKLSADSSQSLKNKILMHIVGRLDIHDSFEQLQLAFQIYENCPDILGPYLMESNFSVEPEYTLRWVTLTSFLAKLCEMRLEEAIEIETIPSVSYLVAPFIPTRAALTRSLINESAVIKLFALRLLKSVLGRVFWTISLVEKEILACERGDFGLTESCRRLPLLIQSRKEALNQAESLLPDIQSLSNVLTGLLSGKELLLPGDLDFLLPTDYRTEMIALALESLQYYIRLFVSQEDALSQAAFEDPVKHLTALLTAPSINEALELPILCFSSAFPRIVLGRNELWGKFFNFLGCLAQQNECEEKKTFSRRVLMKCIYSTGLFAPACKDEVKLIVDCAADFKSASSGTVQSSCDIFVEILHSIQGSFNALVHEQTFRNGVLMSPVLTSWLNQTDGRLKLLAEKVVEELERERKQNKKRPEFQERKEEVRESHEPITNRVAPSNSDSDSDSDSDSGSDSDSESDTRKKNTKKSRVDFELPDPECTDLSIILSQLLVHVDREKFQRFLQEFPLNRRLIPPALRQRVNENMLKDLLFGSEEFLKFCNWLGVLGRCFDGIQRGRLDAYALIESNLIGAMIMGLASRDAAMRRTCGHLLAKFTNHIRPRSNSNNNGAPKKYTGGMAILPNDPTQRTIQVYSLLTHLQRSLTPADEDGRDGKQDVSAIPAAVALFFANAMPIMIKPDHFMYGPIGNFLLYTHGTSRLRRLPLFGFLLRGEIEDCKTKYPAQQQFVERAVYLRQFNWFLRLLEFGSQLESEAAKKETDGEESDEASILAFMKKSRVLDTFLSLLLIFGSTAGLSPDSERSVASLVHWFDRLQSSLGETLEREYGWSLWRQLILDLLKSRTRPAAMKGIKDLLTSKTKR